MKHLLVTNDFPPKVGGIQNLLWEWWRRLPPDSFAVLTSPHKNSKAFDAAQQFEIRRVPEFALLPHPLMARRINSFAAEIQADFVVLDPAVPLGLIGRSLRLPYMVIVHGAEVTVPGRLPVSRSALGYVLRGATHVIAAGSYPAAEARRAAGENLPITVIVPGVDTNRFVMLSGEQRSEARRELGVAQDAQLIVGVSRLVPRKGFDTLIRAAAQLRASHPRLVVAIAGSGRDRNRLEKLRTELNSPVMFLGRVSNETLPLLYGCADIAAMICRSRWGGLEQEGFGIVFAEAASCGVPQIAGASGGAADAVIDGVTGRVIRNPRSVSDVAKAIAELLADHDLRSRMQLASRARAVDEFDYDVLAARLSVVLQVES